MTTSLVGQRTPVAIDDGLIRAGTQTAAFDRAQPDTLLRNYLRLIRRARSQQRAPEISLRREDVEALADYLGESAESVLHRLATLMGSSRTQRTTMLAAFASGALLFGLAGSVSATSPLLDNSVPNPAEGAVAAAVAEETLADAEISGEATDELQSASEVDAAASNPADVPADSSTDSSTDSSAARASTVVVGDTGADRSTSSAPQPTGPSPTGSVATAVVNGGSTGAQPATSGGAGGFDDDVALVTPVAPDLTGGVAVGDAVVPPTTPSLPEDSVNDGNTGNPGADETDVVNPPTTETTIAPTDDIPQELPPVDDDTVAVGPPPLPPPTPTTTAPPTTTSPPPTTTTTTVPTTTTTVPTTTTTVPTTTTTVPTTTTTVPTTTTTPPTVPPTSTPVETTP